jgi:hypothetical protein
MSPLLHDLLPLAADRLEWALNAPTTPDDPHGLARLARALAGITTALSVHATDPDAMPEALGHVDPDMLPFTPLERKAGSCVRTTPPCGRIAKAGRACCSAG